MILGLIPARGGSVGVKRKNVRVLGGKPLIQWTIDTAKDSGAVDRIVVTTDDDEIDSLVRDQVYDVVRRPARLAADHTPMVSVVQHALEECSVRPIDMVLLLQPTTPYRKQIRLWQARKLLTSGGCDSVVSVVRLPADHSAEVQFSLNGASLYPVIGMLATLPTRRQDLEPRYIRDGSVYAFRPSTVLRYGNLYGRECKALEVNPEEAMNINTEADWQEAERRLLVHA